MLPLLKITVATLLGVVFIKFSIWFIQLADKFLGDDTWGDFK